MVLFSHGEQTPFTSPYPAGQTQEFVVASWKKEPPGQLQAVAFGPSLVAPFGQGVQVGVSSHLLIHFPLGQ